MQGQDPKQGNAALSYKESENYAKLLQIYGPGLEAQIEKTVSEHYNLIPKATAVNLLAAINGVLSRQKISISQLNRAQRNFDVEGIVRRIYPIYNPPGGSGAKSVRIVMGDSDGKNEATCVLWGQQSDRVQGEIGIGDKIEVQGAYYRRGEVHAGENSVIRIVEKVPCTNVKNLSYGLLNIEGVVSELFPDYFYMKNGREDKMCAFKLTQPQGSCRVVVWYEPQAVKSLNLGDHMRCENCLYKNNEVHVNFYSRIVVLRQSVKPYKTAKVLEIGTESGGSVLFVETDSGRLWLDGKAALDFLGISALPCGVSMETVIGLKSPYLKGRTLKYDQNPSSSPKTNSKSISPVKAVFLGFEK